MPPVTCEFKIQRAGGGDLDGNIFGKVTPRVKKNGGGPKDQLFVEVEWDPTLGAAPNRLVGRFMFSKAPTASASQVDASPFRTTPAPGHQICYWDDSAQLAAGRYKFGPYIIDDSAELGKYEMTFVATDPNTNIQWSEDPEFDVDG
jgi:hypothetical protein